MKNSAKPFSAVPILSVEEHQESMKNAAAAEESNKVDVATIPLIIDDADVPPELPRVEPSPPELPQLELVPLEEQEHQNLAEGGHDVQGELVDRDANNDDEEVQIVEVRENRLSELDGRINCSDGKWRGLAKLCKTYIELGTRGNLDKLQEYLSKHERKRKAKEALLKIIKDVSIDREEQVAYILNTRFK